MASQGVRSGRDGLARLAQIHAMGTAINYTENKLRTIFSRLEIKDPNIQPAYFLQQTDYNELQGQIMQQNRTIAVAGGGADPQVAKWHF